jgi:hypothetical protein
MSDVAELTVLGFGEAGAPQPSMFEAKARSTVRFADPAAWTTATAVAIAVKDLGPLISEACHEIGMVVVSDAGPAGTMAEVEAGGKENFSSPLRYAASSPGSLAGVSCIAFGFRGPTLNLTMDPPDGIPLAASMCATWLERKVVRFMVLATYCGGDHPSGRAVLLAPVGSSEPSAVPAKSLLTATLLDWLKGSPLKDSVTS